MEFSVIESLGQYHHWEKLETIGSGSYGSVYKVKNVITNGIGAMKCVPYSCYSPAELSHMKKEFLTPPSYTNETDVLAKVRNHPNFVKTIAARFEFDISKAWIVFEYLPTDLRRHLSKSPFSRPLARSCMQQIVTGIAYLHSLYIIHCDIKPDNILYDPDTHTIKIADMGLSRQDVSMNNHGADRSTDIVTLWYRAPELLLGYTRYCRAIDMWSIACLFYEVYASGSQKPLFGGDSCIGQLYCIFQLLGTPNESNWSGVMFLPYYGNFYPNWHKKSLKHCFRHWEPDALNFLQRLLVYHPKLRMNAQQALNHEYIVNEIK